jgi:lysyl-tRNA synthetase class 2
MADQAQAAANAVKEAVNNVADKVSELTTGDNAAAPTLYLDEATGEKVSKTERAYLSKRDNGHVEAC